MSAGRLEFKQTFSRIKEVEAELSKLIDLDRVKNELFWSLHRDGKYQRCNFSLYYSDKIKDIYNKLKTDHGDILNEVEAESMLKKYEG